MTKNTKIIGYRTLVGAFVFLCGSQMANGDLLREGRDAFMNYDFELAMEKYDKYAKSLKKMPDTSGEEILEKYMLQLEIAENSLDNVQKIEIIDRMDVPASEYFKYVKLPATGGRLLNPGSSILKNRHNESDFAYSTESGDLMLWSENGDEQREVIMQSEQLMDGSWETPVKISSVLNEGGNVRNPFLLPDGLTLYFSSDGEGSMGGYDLFVASKDPVTGEFRQPMGLGYPFNSPFNEYMMAIDEDNGIGWWVTDRNQLEGQVTIFIFKTNDVRKNYLIDEEEDIISLARIDDISVTQNPSTDYSRILKDIDIRFNQQKKNQAADFIFPLPGGRIAKRLSDFSSASAKRSMQQYLNALDEYNSVEKKLANLRKQYSNADKKSGTATALGNQIRDLEKKMESQSDQLKKMRNTIISAEIKE